MSAVQEARPELSPVSVPLWREALVGVDWLSLRLSRVYYGIGVPRGEGEAVVVVPGFLGSDTYLLEMYNWLRRIGYRSYYSRIGRNAECPNLLTQRLLETVDKAYDETGKKVHLVGHSLGGLLSRSAAIQRPDIVSNVIGLAAPFRDLKVHPMILAAAGFVKGQIRDGRARQGLPRRECYTPECTCDFVDSLLTEFPASVQRTAIYTENDGVVDWRACIEEDEKLNRRVGGTHVGLTFNPQVYREMARILAAARRNAAA